MPSTLAEALQASLPKSLQDALAEGLGIEARAVPDLDEFGVGETADLEDPPAAYERSPRLAPDAVRFVSEDVMEATKDLLRAHGWHSRAWH